MTVLSPEEENHLYYLQQIYRAHLKIQKNDLSKHNFEMTMKMTTIAPLLSFIQKLSIKNRLAYTEITVEYHKDNDLQVRHALKNLGFEGFKSLA